MNFKVVHTMPEELEDLYPELQGKRGYYIFIEDHVYVYIGSGIKLTDGYSISVDQVEENRNSLLIDLTEHAPEDNHIKKPNPTFPYVIVSLDMPPEDMKIVEHIVVRNTDNMERYERIML